MSTAIIDGKEDPPIQITPKMQQCLNALAMCKAGARSIEPTWYNLQLFIESQNHKAALLEQLWEQIPEVWTG